MSTAVQQPIVELSKHDINYLMIATKMTVLSTVMATSTVTLISVALASTILGNDFLGGFLWYFGAMLGLMIDSTINVFCIYLSFPYSTSRTLYKYICKPALHRCCYSIAKKNYLKKFRKQKCHKADRHHLTNNDRNNKK